MKKPLVLFIIFVVLFVFAKIAYTKYCASKPEGCNDDPPYDGKSIPEEYSNY